MRFRSFAVLCVALMMVASVGMASHVPPASEVIVYDGSLAPGTPATGSIGFADPEDGYDWYCLDVTAGTAVTLTVTRTSGDIVPNLGVMTGLAEAGGTASMTLVDHTENDAEDETTLTFTPETSGTVTIWISTFLDEDGGEYSISQTGGLARAACSADAEAPPPPPFVVLVPTEETFISNDETLVIPVDIQIDPSFDDAITLEVSGLPGDVTTSLSQNPLPRPGRGNVNLTIRTSAMTLPGTYVARVTAFGGGTSAANTFLVTVYCEPPRLLALSGQPQNTSVPRGGVATVSVSPSGTGPFFYQWYSGHRGLRNFPLPGATGRVLTTSSINDTSDYWVRVSNACGSVDSQTVTVTPIAPTAKPSKKRSR
ncbi:MAG TPA: hypothetical protein VGF69_22225 [Thermoanaerobaculia bacterium]|jgi:hypothetical protein